MFDIRYLFHFKSTDEKIQLIPKIMSIRRVSHSFHSVLKSTCIRPIFCIHSGIVENLAKVVPIYNQTLCTHLFDIAFLITKDLYHI